MVYNFVRCGFAAKSIYAEYFILYCYFLHYLSNTVLCRKSWCITIGFGTMANPSIAIIPPVSAPPPPRGGHSDTSVYGSLIT